MSLLIKWLIKCHLLIWISGTELAAGLVINTQPFICVAFSLMAL